MIYTTFAGRCGNQLFAYAISRKLQEHYHTDIVFCDEILQKQNKESGESFRNELEAFATKPYQVDHSAGMAIYKYGSFSQKLLFKIYSAACKLPYKTRPDFYKRQTKWQPLLNQFGIYDLVHGYSPLRYTRQKHQFVNGTYEDEKWFADIKEALQKELTAKQADAKNDQLMDIIQNKNSVCISIRRGDFLNAENRGLRDICNEQYFREAIARMKELVPDMVCIFFSDEIDWVRENYDFGIASYYEDGTDSISEKLRLMSSCKHFILSNSTFSWWAQYLCTNPDKVVISPERWFNMPGYKHQLIGDDFILIDCS